jgi:hypothetical protein
MGTMVAGMKEFHALDTGRRIKPSSAQEEPWRPLDQVFVVILLR